MTITNRLNNNNNFYFDTFQIKANTAYGAVYV